MSQSVVLTGAQCKVYFGGKLYESLQSLNYTIDYGETEIYGMDSQHPQEIAPTRMSVQGSVNGLRIKLTGGLQGYDMRTKISQVLFGPYVSLRIKDRHSGQDIFWCPQVKITSENVQIMAKGVVKLNFNFKGIIPYNALDLNG